MTLNLLFMTVTFAKRRESEATMQHNQEVLRHFEHLKMKQELNMTNIHM